MGIPAFVKILHIGTAGTEHLFDNEVEVSEKLDGSQWSVGKIEGHLYMRSKGAEVYPQTAPQMFEGAVEWALRIQHKIPDNCVIHGEYFMRPKHNCLAYNSIPKGGFAIFGVRNLPDKFVVSHDELRNWATTLDCDVVPLVDYGNFTHEDIIKKADEWLSQESVLGGPKMEGIVVKNYHQTGLLGGHILPILCGKYVREDFKEENKTNWKIDNPGHLVKIGEMVRTEARWNKAIQFRRDCGELEGQPRDIGPLLQYIQKDIEEEEKEELKNKLYQAFRKEILRTATRGFANWYKEKLLRGEIEPSKTQSNS